MLAFPSIFQVEFPAMEFLRDREAFARLANRADMRRDNWYEINARADVPEIAIYSEIGYIGATSEEFVSELSGITAPEIRVRINSMGGSVFEGLAIYNALRSHPAHITTQVDAMAASIASVIAQAGDHRVMMERSQMMIHEAHGIALGATADDMRELADVLDRQTDNIAEIYAAAKGDGRSKSHFVNLMKASGKNMGTLLTDAEAVGEGLADEVFVPPAKARAPDVTETPPPPPDDRVDFAALFDTDIDDFEWDKTPA